MKSGIQETLRKPSSKLSWFGVLLLIAAAIAAYRFNYTGEAGARKAYHTANQLLLEGKSGDAKRLYEQTIRLDPKMVNAHNNLANLFVAEGKITEAIRQYRKAIEIYPNYVEAYNNLGVALASINQIKEAHDFYALALKRFPDSPELHNSYGTILTQEGKFFDAQKHFKKALRLRPDYERAKQNLQLIEKRLNPT